MPSRQELSLQPFFQQAETMAQGWKDFENARMEEGRDPWPIFNTTLADVDAFFQPVLQGKTIKRLAQDIRNQHGQLIAINIGSNNNPLEEIREAGDIFISIGLQELRTNEQIRRDMQRDYYFIPGTVGSPELWDHQLPDLLTHIQRQGKIREKYVNFLLENLGLGWDSLPVSQKFITEYENVSNISKQQPFPKLKKQAFANYFCWMATKGFQFIHPEGGIGLADFPEETDSFMKRWYKNNSEQFNVEKQGYQIFVQKRPTDPSRLTI